MRTLLDDASAIEFKASSHLDHAVDVRDYGAVGDGVADDGAAINSAIAACGGAGGGTVWFPPGAYHRHRAMDGT